MNKEFTEFVRMNEKNLKKSVDNLKGTEFLDAFCIVQHLKALEQENINLKQALTEIREVLKRYKNNLWLETDILRNEILELVDKAIGESNDK